MLGRAEELRLLLLLLLELGIGHESDILRLGNELDGRGDSTAFVLFGDALALIGQTLLLLLLAVTLLILADALLVFDVLTESVAGALLLLLLELLEFLEELRTGLLAGLFELWTGLLAGLFELWTGLLAGLFKLWPGNSDRSGEFIEGPRGGGGRCESDELLAEVQILVGSRNALLQGRLELVVPWVEDELGGEAALAGSWGDLDQVKLRALLGFRSWLGNWATFNKDFFIVIEDWASSGTRSGRSSDFRARVARETGDFIFQVERCQLGSWTPQSGRFLLLFLLGSWLDAGRGGLWAGWCGLRACDASWCLEDLGDFTLFVDQRALLLRSLFSVPVLLGNGLRLLESGKRTALGSSLLDFGSWGVDDSWTRSVDWANNRSSGSHRADGDGLFIFKRSFSLDGVGVARIARLVREFTADTISVDVAVFAADDAIDSAGLLLE